METGFAVVTNHGIDFGLIKDAQDVWKHFFTNPPAVKEYFTNKEDPNLGYIGFGKEKAVGANKADLKEWYHWRPGGHIPSDALNVTQKLFHLMESDLAPQFLKALNGIGSNMDYAEICNGSDNTILRTLYYPALNTLDFEEGAVRSAAHEDINFITLLVAATSSGLQVQDKAGNWHNVPHEENSLVVNIGDSLQLASGGVLKSTTHRVTNPANSNADRISMPMFIHPKRETILAPGVTAQQYLVQRLQAIYQKGYSK
jgi:isopenicillin N synthase-like dioxygenase